MDDQARRNQGQGKALDTGRALLEQTEEECGVETVGRAKIKLERVHTEEDISKPRDYYLCEGKERILALLPCISYKSSVLNEILLLVRV